MNFERFNTIALWGTFVLGVIAATAKTTQLGCELATDITQQKRRADKATLNDSGTKQPAAEVEPVITSEIVGRASSKVANYMGAGACMTLGATVVSAIAERVRG